MLKRYVTILIFTTMLTAVNCLPTLGNDPSTPPIKKENDSATARPALEMKQVVAEKTHEIKTSLPEFQENRYSKKAWDDNEQQKPKKGWTKKHTLWTVAIAATAVGVFLLIKYSKKCLEYERFCLPDEVCNCLVYEQ